MLKISKQSDYGLLILSYLKNKKDLIPLSELVLNLKLPKRFIARIASILVKYQLLLSKEGKTGGYQLSPKVNEFSLYDYLKIFERDLYVTKCSDDNYYCQWEDYCQHKSLFKDRLKKIFIDKLKSYQLLKVV